MNNMVTRRAFRMDLGVAVVESVWTERVRVLWVPQIGVVMDSRFLFSDWHIFYRRIIGLDQLDLNPLKNLTRGCLVYIQDLYRTLIRWKARWRVVKCRSITSTSKDTCRLAKYIATRTIYSFLIWNERWIERMRVLALNATLRILCLIYCRTIWWYISRHWVKIRWILVFKAIWEMWLVSGHREIVCLRGLDWNIQRMNVLSPEAVRKARYITI